MILEVAGLRKSFARQFSLEIDRLSVEAGESVLLQGENGSGKTTLLKLLAGLTRPDSCERFVFDGRTRTRWDCDPGIAFLHQSPYLFDMSVRANVEYGLRQRADPEASGKALAALESADMAGFADRRVDDLSGGEAQRVALARIWALKPKLYLLDEPLSHLDAAGAREVGQLLAKLAKDGASLIVSSHEDMENHVSGWRRIRISKGQLEG